MNLFHLIERAVLTRNDRQGLATEILPLWAFPAVGDPTVQDFGGIEPRSDTPDPRLVALIAERLRCHDTIPEAAEDIAAAVWAWLAEGDEMQ